jgi:glycosyltransferase involved in cell wall biosynthesis
VRRRPRLLFLAYYFPPLNAIGAVRTYNIAKWLTRRGWEVTVVTPAASVWRNAENTEETDWGLAREGVRLMRTDHRWRMLSPDNLECPDSWPWFLAGGAARRLARLSGLEMEIGWMAEAERACAGLEPSDVDLILASGTPFESFAVANRLAERLGRPFVMDYRDLWTANPHAGAPAGKGTHRHEAQLLARSAALTAVSPGVAESLRLRCTSGKPVHVITNGYDPEELADIQPFDFGHFAIVYAGSFYPPKRVITPIVTALRRLKDLHPKDDWAFHYYGWHSDHVRSSADQCGVRDRVFLHGFMSRREVLAAVKGAGVAVVIASVKEDADRGDRGIVTGKVFDAIGLGTPMLVVAPAGSDLENIVRTAGRGERFSGAEIDRMAAFLAKAIEGQVPRSGRREVYAWPNLVTKLDAVLRTALDGKQAESEMAGAGLRSVEG